MKKILSLFPRNYEGDRKVRNEIVPGAEWVVAGEGVATRKWDGTSCLIREGKLYKRYEIKPGGKAPANFQPANEVDENTGKQQGWVPVGESADDQWHREAFARSHAIADGADGAGGAGSAGRVVPLVDGTYELCGPKIQGNPENVPGHYLLTHGDCILPDAPRDFEGLLKYFQQKNIEGIVWHHPDGRMVKIKARDFGIKRSPAPKP